MVTGVQTCALPIFDQAHLTLDAVFTKSRFWQQWAATPLNQRQVKLLNRLLDGFDGFDGKLTSSKWAAIAKCSPDTALRDIHELLARGIFRKSAAGGRSTSYELAGGAAPAEIRNTYTAENHKAA